MLKSIAVLTFSLALAAPALAQDGGRPEGGGPGARPGMGEPMEHPFLSGRYLQLLERRLSLTPEQKTKAQAAIDGSREALQAKFGAMKKLREEMRALEKTINDKIKTSLTEEQLPMFEQFAQGPQRMAGPAPKGGGRGPQGGGRGGERRSERDGPRGE